jgi:ABC-type transport system substrate-binding protein
MIPYDRLFKQLQGTDVGDESRQEICTQLEKILRDEILAIVLFHEQSFYFVRPELRNIDASINPFERKFYELVWLAPGPAP